jgi:ATP-dependent DNA helicase DinG
MHDVGPEDVADVLRRATEPLPGGGEVRTGQTQMAQAVARAVKLERHLVVQAGTGTGKSLAYLVPLALLGVRTVVATATKHLQDQLAGRDLPLVQRALGARRFRFAVLKGRANYLCRQRVNEIGGGTAPADQLLPAPNLDAAPGPGPGTVAAQVRRLVAWAEHTDTGERDALDFEPHGRAWEMVSTTARECPGAYRCPSGPDCFAELARAMAEAADVVVVNSHLYAAHLASGGAVLPPHDVVVFDEAHAVEDVMTDGLGLELTPGRLRAAAVSAAGLLDPAERAMADGVADAGERLDAALIALVGRRVLREDESGSEAPHGAESELRAVLSLTEGRLTALVSALRRAGPAADGAGDSLEMGARRSRAILAASHLREELSQLIALDPDHVAWVEEEGPGGRRRSLHAAPVEIGPVLAERLWPEVTAVLTSATVPPLAGRRLGLPPGSTDELDVGSPFPFAEHALLYCAAHLPDRRSADAETAIHGELATLIDAAGGRTLALFTSWRAMRTAVEALRPVVGYRVLAQNDLPKPALVDAFANEESACLFATMSFWQGVDVPGPTLSLVAVDRIPFPRPDDPLLEARRERAGGRAFAEVDLPRAATLLAQGAGRLIRSTTDRGVVAVLDRRLAMAGYARELRAALAPMPFTTDRSRAVEFLAAITACPSPSL